jgi:hypothetical protein
MRKRRSDEGDHSISLMPRWRVSSVILFGSIGAALVGALLIFVWTGALYISGRSADQVESYLVPAITWWLLFAVVFVYIDGFIVADRLARWIGSRLSSAKRIVAFFAIVLMAAVLWVGLLRMVIRHDTWKLIDYDVTVLWWGWFVTRCANVMMSRNKSSTNEESVSLPNARNSRQNNGLDRSGD